jgi:hypothetical protein
VVTRTANNQTSYYLSVHSGAFNGFTYYLISDASEVRARLANAARNLADAQPTNELPAVNNPAQNVVMPVNNAANPAPTVTARTQAIQGQPMVVVLANNNVNGQEEKGPPQALPTGTNGPSASSA